MHTHDTCTYVVLDVNIYIFHIEEMYSSDILPTII